VRRLSLLVGAIVLVDTMFYAAITPLLPRLAHDLDLGKNGAGALAGAYAAGTLIGSLPAGWLAARAGVKATVLSGLALMSVSGLVFAFGASIAVLDAARFMQGVGGACSWAGGMAWLAAEAPPERRGEMIGSVLGAAIFGVQLGPVLGALATWVGREAAFSTAVLFGLALGVWAWTVPAAPGSATLKTPASALRERSMLAGMWLTALPAAAFGVMDVLAPLRLAALGATALALGATFFAAAGIEAIVSPTAGRAADRRGALPVARAGLAIGATALVVLQLPTNAWSLAIVVVFVAGLLGVLWVPAGLLLTSGAERIGLDTAYAFAFFNLGWAAGFTIGAAGGGALAQATSDPVPYLLIAAAYAASLAVASSTRRRQPLGAGGGARPGH
jgi:predicted MFS family arabinose efflux permease